MKYLFLYIIAKKLACEQHTIAENDLIGVHFCTSVRLVSNSSLGATDLHILRF